MREKVERGTAPRSQWSQRQHGPLDRSRARHFLSMRAPLGDFLREAAKRVREVDEFRQRWFQVVKQAQVEIVLAERLQRALNHRTRRWRAVEKWSPCSARRSGISGVVEK